MHKAINLRSISCAAGVIACCAVAMLFALVGVTNAAAQPNSAPGSAPSADQYQRTLTVGFDSNATARDRVNVRRSVGVTAQLGLAAPGLQQVSVPVGRSLAAAASELRRNGKVDFVELPGSVYKTMALPTELMPNDPYLNYYSSLWGLHNTGSPYAASCNVDTTPCPDDQKVLYSGTANADIDAPLGWGAFPGGAPWLQPAASGEPIAIVDTGVRTTHEDLADNIWTNGAEDPSNGGVDDVDDDPYTGADGGEYSFIDDLHGWDFVGELVDDGGTPDDPDDDIRTPPDNDPDDTYGHGTHVASIAAAVGNNGLGGVGVNPIAAIMPLRVGNGDTLDNGAIQAAFSYAIDHGVRVINGSFGGGYESPALRAIIEANPNVLFVFAAGNDGLNHDLSVPPEPPDAVSTHPNRTFPCDFPAENVICVASTDANDQLSDFSDYGHSTVDVAAPGEPILGAGLGTEASPNDGYIFRQGTSMATPHVSGAASLLWTAYPTLEASQVKTLLLTTVDFKPALASKIGFGGRLNLGKAMVAAATPPAPGWPETPAPPATQGNPPAIPQPPAPLPPLPLPPPAMPTPAAASDTTPPAVTVSEHRKIEISRSGVVRFRVSCDERCKVTLRTRANVRHVRTLKTSFNGRADRVRTIRVRYRGSQLRLIRRALKKRGRIGLKMYVSVKDAAGNVERKTYRSSLVRKSRKQTRSDN